MVYSLAHRERWKYTDDIAIGETILADTDVASSLQKVPIIFDVMQRNPMKEMLISFKRKTPVIAMSPLITLPLKGSGPINYWT